MRRKIPSTTALLCFEAAAKCENFALAAQSINMSQSAFSRQVQELEKQLGQSLFSRRRQRVYLTDAGRMLANELSPLLQQLEISLLLASSHTNPHGAINIGTYPTLGSRWLMPLLAKFSQHQARTTFNTITYLDNQHIDDHVIDIGIVQGDPPWSGYRADFLMAETLVVIAAPGSHQVIDENQLLEQRILQHSTRPESWRIWFNSLNKLIPMEPIGPWFSQYEMLISAVKDGLGIALVPELLVDKELANGELVLAHPHKVTPPSAYYLITPEAKVGMARIEAFRQWLLASRA